MTNRFTKKPPTNVQGGIMRPPSDGGLKMIKEISKLTKNSAEKYLPLSILQHIYLRKKHASEKINAY